ncbi:hypothetical protein MMC13_008181 [Lambiella insularis]|nr:hypothetical protein [Lambiella insularis]
MSFLREERRYAMIAFPPQIPSCTSTHHLLVCGHFVRTVSPLCSGKCYQPRWGAKRSTLHTCLICTIKSDTSRLVQELDRIEYGREWLRCAEYKYPPYAQELEDFREQIAEHEMGLRDLVPRKLYRRYRREGRKVLEDELIQRKEFEKQAQQEAERQASDSLLEYYRSDQARVTMIYLQGRVGLVRCRKIDVRFPQGQLRFKQFPRFRGETDAMVECRYRHALSDFLLRKYTHRTDLYILEKLIQNDFDVAIKLPLRLLEELQDILAGYQPVRYLGDEVWEHPSRRPLVQLPNRVQLTSCLNRAALVDTTIEPAPVAETTPPTILDDEEAEDDLETRAIQVYTEGLVRVQAGHPNVRVEDQLATGELRFWRFPPTEGEPYDELELRYREELSGLLFINTSPI